MSQEINLVRQLKRERNRVEKNKWKLSGHVSHGKNGQKTFVPIS